MPSRPVLIGRGLVTHTHHKTTTRAKPPTRGTTTRDASTIQNLNQQTHPQPDPTRTNRNQPEPTGTRGNQGFVPPQVKNGSQRYGGHSGQETPGPIPNPEV